MYVNSKDRHPRQRSGSDDRHHRGYSRTDDRHHRDDGSSDDRHHRGRSRSEDRHPRSPMTDIIGSGADLVKDIIVIMVDQTTDIVMSRGP